MRLLNEILSQHGRMSYRKDIRKKLLDTENKILKMCRTCSLDHYNVKYDNKKIFV